MIPTAVLLLALAIASCDMDSGPAALDPGGCTVIGCEDQLAVSVGRRDGKPFSPGSYDVAVGLSGADPSHISCTLDGAGDLACGASPEDLRVEIDQERTAFEVRISQAPPSVYISLAYEGKPIGDEALSPDYAIVTPNGPECDPTCFQASVSIAVASTD